MNSRAPNSRHVLAREIFKLVCMSFLCVCCFSTANVGFSDLLFLIFIPAPWGHVSSVSSRPKNRLTEPKERQRGMGRWSTDTGKKKQRSIRRLGVRLGRCGGSGDFRTALGAICQKPKPFPISASHVSLPLSLPSLSITTSAFFLPSHTPLLTVSHLFFPHA